MAETRMRTVMVATKHLGAAAIEAMGALVKGDRMVLRREPENIHDAGAVACYSQAGIKIGYLPRHSNGPSGAALDAGLDVIAIVDLAGAVHGNSIGAVPHLTLSWETPDNG
jgi:hypothetical protein